MQNVELNLARKLRPKTFNEMIGQDLSVKILKNGLYLKKYFPVYIFSGNRGCGKTTSARLLAAAINCENLEKFQADPKKHEIPCLTCSSCLAMASLTHPDFIEVDAASNTGVDNVRQILEASSYMPLMGNKKIYLVDEAHMLSKAAFNAFLKVLEEPPASVIFVLATTELQKIPETVRSRAFQLFFGAVNFAPLKEYLNDICEKEKIRIDSDALDLIVQETEGSIRDAINLLERIRLVGENISLEDTLKLLGKISYNDLIDLFDCLIEGSVESLLNRLNIISFDKISPNHLWEMLILLNRTLLWIKFGVAPKFNFFEKLSDRLNKSSKIVSVEALNSLLQLFWENEDLFLRTSQKGIFLESFLIDVCSKFLNGSLISPTSLDSVKKNSLDKGCVGQAGKIGMQVINSNVSTIKANSTVKEAPSYSVASQNIEIEPSRSPAIHSQAVVQPTNNTTQIDSFLLENICEIDDDFLGSIFKQATVLNFDKENKVLNLALSNNSSFFKAKVEDSKLLFLPILKVLDPTLITFGINFLNVATDSLVKKNERNLKNGDFEPKKDNLAQKSGFSFNNPIDSQKSFSVNKSYGNSSAFVSSKSIDISDQDKWPKANLILKYFPGRIEKAD